MAPWIEKYGGPWNSEVDVVVVGAGGAGLAAAIELLDAGSEIVVFEKQASIQDASSSLSGGAMAFAGTDFQEREGIQDSNELLYKDLMDVGQWKNVKELVEVYIRDQLETYYWLKGLGVNFFAIQAFGGMSVPRGHATDADEQLTILEDNAKKRGANIIFETKVTGLCTDTHERVTGVIVEGKGGVMRIKAKKGVILATGGLGRDVERLTKIDPRYSQVLPVVGTGHTGDGHRMAEVLGAIFRDMEYIKPTFGLHINGTSNKALTLMFFNGAIIVNKEGKRFVKESLTYKDIAVVSLGQPSGMGYQIFDQKICEEGLRKGSKPWGLDELRLKLADKADTLEELAEKIEISPAALKHTIQRYNTYVEAGKDLDFGRTALAGGVGKIVKIDTPPFYAYPSKSLFPATYAGIAVDKDMHVLSDKGRIVGLYAAGEIVGGFHGANYMSGSSLGKAVIFGRIAGRNAAKGV